MICKTGNVCVTSVLCHSHSNPDLRRTEPILESPLQRTSSGSSSSSSTPSSQPSSQGGSQPGSQAGSSERTRVRGKTLSYLYLAILPGRKAVDGERKVSYFLTLVQAWPPLCDPEEPLNCSQPQSPQGSGPLSLIVCVPSVWTKSFLMSDTSVFQGDHQISDLLENTVTYQSPEFLFLFDCQFSEFQVPANVLYPLHQLSCLVF